MTQLFEHAHEFNFIFLVLSIIVAILSSYTGLGILVRLSKVEGKKTTFWLGSGAVALGLGVWASHFVVMIAMVNPADVHFEMELVFFSLFMAIGLLYISLYLCQRAIKRNRSKSMAPYSFGISIALIHLVVMEAIHGTITFHPVIVPFSVIMAIVSSKVILKNVLDSIIKSNFSQLKKSIFSMLLAATIILIHLTTMLGTSLNTNEYHYHHSMLNLVELASWIGIGSFVILIQLLSSLLIERKFLNQSDKLFQTEQDYLSLFDHNTDIIVKLSVDGAILSLNHAAENLTGYTSNEWKNKQFCFLLDKDYAEVSNEKFNEAKEGRAVSYESVLLHKSGTPIYVDMTKLPIYHKRKVVGVYVIAKDRSKQKEILTELEMSEDRFRSLVELSPKAILVQQDNQVVYVNPKALEMVGATHEEQLLGKHLLDFIHPEEKEVYQERVEGIKRNEPVNLAEYKIQTQDNKTIFVQATGSRINFNGKPAIMTLASDVTENRMLQERLMVSEQQYKSLFEYNKNAVYAMDIEGNFTSVNKVAKELSGYSEHECLSMSVMDLVLPDDHFKLREVLEQALSGHSQSIDLRIIHKNGKIIFVNSTAIPIIIDQKVVGVYGISQDITEFVESQKLIQQMAYQDYLTGLPNRNRLDKRLSQELREATKKGFNFALLFIDLDRFKSVNDTLGHATGDQLLIEVAKRLTCSIRENDMVFRQGGDEFIIILHDIDQATVIEVATRIIEALQEPATIDNYDIFTTPSIGISLYPEDGTSVESLIKHADAAMYQAKKAGKNTYRFYSMSDDQQSIDPLKIEMGLHKALEQDEFVLHFQPKVNLKTGRIVGTEALIRWKHPELGMIPPGHFISIAEETGLIIPIGEWALSQACYQNKQWHDKGYSSLVVSVNISTRQFSQTDLVKTVASILEKTGLEARYLELEITESMTADIEHTITMLQQLKKLGVQISIDDFGTGFSSLNYLKQFPVDTLKIDQSFVRELHNNPNEETIVKTIISMAHNLQLSVVAEGIENREQLVFLQQHLCEDGQGYFFSKPLPADELETAFFDIEKMVKKFGLSDDLTQQRWFEESVRMARKELHDTIRQQQGITLKFKKINGRFIHTLCDGELLYRLGLIPEQVVGHDLFDIYPIEIAQAKTEHYQKAWNGEEHVTYEVEINGIYYLAALNPIKRGGEVVEVIGSCVDITKLKKTERELRESQNKYSMIANNMSDLVTIFDLTGTIVYASPSHEIILGHSPAYYEGKSTLAPSHPDYDEKSVAIFNDTIKNRRINRAEIRLATRDGEWILFDSVLTPIMDQNGEVIQVVGVARKEGRDLVGNLGASLS